MAIILSGGLGKRLRPFAEVIPKLHFPSVRKLFCKSKSSIWNYMASIILWTTTIDLPILRSILVMEQPQP
jgi:hypothetical protein